LTLKNTNATVRVRSSVDNDGEITQMEVIADARYAHRNGKYYIMYEETGLSEMRGCITTVKVEEGGKVWVKRSGAVDTNMCYEVGQTHSCVYEFDFGSITMETHATQIDAALTPNGGQLDMRYRLDMGAVKSENHLNISIKEKEDGENNH
jgi:uncharacterized beta-barrel protein YwiB (DUF1934 family)